MTGVAPEAVERLIAEIANLSNNPTKLDPPRLLFPQALEINERRVIKIQVPASSNVHQTAGHVYLRSQDGDYRISGLNRIAALVNRKMGTYTEQRVLPYLEMSDLRPDLFEKAKALMEARKPKHPWVKLSPEALLNIAGFVRRDVFTGKVGYTLAAALMFGTDSIIQSVAPGYKFDALLRRRDTERYDDRELVCTNLIDSFDILMGFIDKHLNDPFYLEGVIRVSLRSLIFRELVANIIAHREYVNASPATIKIYQDRVEFKNPNIPHGHGPIDPLNFTPYPKNPTICQFMIQLGQFESLGSGINKVTHYHPFYAPGAPPPTFIEDDMFTTLIPLVSSGAESGAESLLRALLVTPLTTAEWSKKAGRVTVTGAFKRSMRDLLAESLVERTLPERPQSRLQKYRLTDKGRAALRGAKRRARGVQRNRH